MQSTATLKTLHSSRRTRSLNLSSQSYARHTRLQTLSRTFRTTTPSTSPPSSSHLASNSLKGLTAAIDKLALKEAIRESSGSGASSGSEGEEEVGLGRLDASEETEREYTAPVRRGATIEVPLVDLVTVSTRKQRRPANDFELIPSPKTIIALDEDDFGPSTSSSRRAVNNTASSAKKAVQLVQEDDDEDDWDLLAGSEILERAPAGVVAVGK